MHILENYENVQKHNRNKLIIVAIIQGQIDPHVGLSAIQFIQRGGIELPY